MIVDFVRSGTFAGVGLGSTLHEVAQAMLLGFVDEAASADLFRRDYGLVECTFAREDEWRLRGVAIEMHRLASTPEVLQEWNTGVGEAEPLGRYTKWNDVAALLPGGQKLTRTEQGGFVEYRAEAAGVSVMVVAGDEARGDWPGCGDVWSVHLGA